MNQSINTDSKNSKEPQQKYRLGTVSIKILGGLNQFYGHPTSKLGARNLSKCNFFSPANQISRNKHNNEELELLSNTLRLYRNLLKTTDCPFQMSVMHCFVVKFIKPSYHPLFMILC